MILAAFGFAALGLYFLIRGDGPARLVGVGLIVLAAVFGFLMWIALNVERPPQSATAPSEVIAHV